MAARRLVQARRGALLFLWLARGACGDGGGERTTSDLSESLRRRGETRTYHAYVAKQQSKLAQYPEKIRAIDVARQHQIRREFQKALDERTGGVDGFVGRTVLCLGARRPRRRERARAENADMSVAGTPRGRGPRLQEPGRGRGRN